jgi:hypothetical protein
LKRRREVLTVRRTGVIAEIEIVRLPWRHHGIEQRAAEIEDPLERLRYLRQTVGQPADSIRVFKWQLPLDSWRTRGTWIVLSLAVLTAVAWRPGHSTSRAANIARPALQRPGLNPAVAGSVAGVLSPHAVWLVETRNGVEIYSNGLRIDDKYAVANEPREKFPVYGYAKTGPAIIDWRTTPAGIVYHTSESLLLPFEQAQNNRLVRVAHEVLEYVQGKRCYHFVIDRFGGVFRIVKETDRANHAGNSIWGDDKGAYVNLNNSFLGVSFESATAAEKEKTATPAQIHSARVLTEMLRAKYAIRAADCVTHGQVSVNPSNMLIGYHTDWAGVFPFAELGLPDNYATPPASLFAFGFGYDDSYVKLTGDHVWQGLLLAEDQMRRQAFAAGQSPSKYKASLQQRYRQITAALKSKSPEKEKSDEIE